MAVSELEKKADSISRLPSMLKSSHRGASSKGGKTSYSYWARHGEEVCGNWQVFCSLPEHWLKALINC